VNEAGAEGAAQPSPTADPVLSVQGLGKRYGEREALRDVSFEVAAGELVAIVGPNGAGKTTLLSILVGVQAASTGSVGGSAAPPRGAGSGAATIGWAPQQPALYSKLTVRENLRLFARLEGVADVAATVARMLAQTGLAERAGERVEKLSGGNRQRVNVALGLLADPPVLALDEPSSALDPGQRARLWEFVAGLAAGGTSVLFSTHHLGEVRRYATRAIVLADGEVLFDGKPDELLDRGGGEDLEGSFLSLLRQRGHS
jgi:ABC-2 type transport system ATP-binding protein